MCKSENCNFIAYVATLQVENLYFACSVVMCVALRVLSWHYMRKDLEIRTARRHFSHLEFELCRKFSGFCCICTYVRCCIPYCGGVFQAWYLKFRKQRTSFVACCFRHTFDCAAAINSNECLHVLDRVVHNASIQCLCCATAFFATGKQTHILWLFCKA